GSHVSPTDPLLPEADLARGTSRFPWDSSTRSWARAWPTNDRRPLLVRAKTLVAAAVVAALALCASTSGLAARGAPPTVARDLAQLYFSNTLTRAEVLSYVGRVPHDYRIDEGKITAIRQG